ncbi:MAG: hypothetical protein ABI680_01775, partial [Chthoniobacteraceae bacterium]
MKLAKWNAALSDGIMGLMMSTLMRRHPLNAGSRTAFERYVKVHANVSRDEYFEAAPLPRGDYCLTVARRNTIRWFTPIGCSRAENNHCQVDYYFCDGGLDRPTVLMLHALMSASDFGYRRWAAAFNARGWNACFIHLPYHYSRKPRGTFNGELAITADFVRTAEALRQGVCELRQLMSLLRAHGCQEFGLWATSYGGWIGALLASVERGFRFVALMAPIVDVTHALWTSPAGRVLTRQLERAGITRDLVEQHYPLVSPMHAPPLNPADRVWFSAGEFDHFAPRATIERLHEKWPGSKLRH